MLAECTHTTMRWAAAPDGGVYLGHSESHYGADGRLLQERSFSVADALMTERVYVYEPDGRLIDERFTVARHGMTASTSSHLDYDADGRLLSRTTTQSPSISTERVNRTYGADGRLQREEHLSEQGGYRWQWFDMYSYGTQGRLETVETFSGGELRRRRAATYDTQGRLARVDESGPNAVGPGIYTYPAEGGWITQHRAPGSSETWRYDSQGRLLEVNWGGDSSTGGESFGFDAAGRLQRHQKWDMSLRNSASEGQTHTYDEEGRRVSSETTRHWFAVHTYPVDRSEERTLTAYTYDEAGQFRMREERVLYARNGFETHEWESAPPGFLLERTEARGRACRPPPDAPPPHDSYAFPQ